MFLIGIYGPLGSGKSTLARMICQSFHNPMLLPFAYPLKKFAVDLGWDGKKDEKGRRLLQLLGTEIGRHCISEDIWINHWERAKSEAQTNGNDIVIVDDMRFENEMDYIQHLQGITIAIEGRDQYTSEEQMYHASETGLLTRNDFNFIFDNAGTIDDLQVFAQTVVDFLHV